ncbi:hypothetical protein D9M71_422250 [compost metagenome]
MVVGVVQAQLGIVEALQHLAHGQAVLPAVMRIVTRPARYEGACGQGVGRGAVATDRSNDRPAAFRGKIGDLEERAATVEHRGTEVVLVEALQAQGVAQAEVEREHLHRQLAFLELDPGTVERRHVQGVDGIDTVLEEQCLTPAQHLLAELDVQRFAGDIEVFPDIGVQGFEALEPGQVRVAGVVKLFEVTVAGFQSMVVPVLEADEGALAAVIEVEIGQALEYLRNRIVLLEVQAAVVAIGIDTFAVLADTGRVRSVQQPRIGIAQRPARAQGQRGVGAQRPAVIDLEGRGPGLGTTEQRQRHTPGQQAVRMRGKAQQSAFHAGFTFYCCFMAKRSPCRCASAPAVRGLSN